MNKILIFLLFITSHSYAQNIVVETYCFSSEAQSVKAQQSSKYLMLPADRIEPKGECFSLFTTESRRELIQKYLLSSYPQMTVSYSSMERSASEMCNLRVEKIKNQNTFRTKAQIQALGMASVGETTSNSKEVSQMKAMSGAPFELQVDQQKIEGKCRYITATKYEIEFSMQFIPRPLIPPVPEGTVVIIQNPPTSEVQQGTSLSTTVQLSQGEKIEIGSIAKNLAEKGHSASLIPKLSYEKTEGSSQEKIYLLME
jgi:hypothetical protein